VQELCKEEQIPCNLIKRIKKVKLGKKLTEKAMASLTQIQKKEMKVVNLEFPI